MIEHLLMHRVRGSVFLQAFQEHQEGRQIRQNPEIVIQGEQLI